MNYFDIDEDQEIYDIISDHHLIFQTFYSLGKPMFSEEVDTAAVAFDRKGKFLYMVINKSFWDQLDSYNRAFILAHECLHIILNHGYRGLRYENHKNVNIAQDIVINEMLVNGFKFNKYKIKKWNNLCFVETIFHPETVSRLKIQNNKSFEYYLELIEKNKSKDKDTLDQHDFDRSTREKRKSKIGKDIQNFKNYGEDASDIINEEIMDSLSEEEINNLNQIFDDEFKSILGSKGISIGGVGKGNYSTYLQIKVGNIKKSNKWEKIVTSKIKSLKVWGEFEKDSWISKKRRNYGLGDDLITQGTWVEKGYHKDKYNLVFFLDTSGSCLFYSQRFLDLLLSIPQNKFNINAYTFTKKIYPIDLKNPQLLGNGGTCFKILGDKIKEIEKEKNHHPDLVFVLSDGWGTQYESKFPERWHWMLTPYNVKDYILKGSNVHELKDFI
jgi:predicted metal-dependent peptidase